MDDSLDLLLVEADDTRPVLGDGLPSEASERAPKPKKAGRRADTFKRRRRDADPNDLTLQKWAIVAPEGKEGDRLLESVEPLRRLREDEQGAPVTVYRVAPDMDARQADTWKQEIYWSEEVTEDDRPLYLTLLGDPARLSLDLQQVMTSTALVGRLAFTDAAGRPDVDSYAAYAEKVVRHAVEGNLAPAPDFLFHVAADGTRATMEADARLVSPSFDAAQEGLDRGKLPAASVRRLDAESVEALLEAGQSERPSVLLSVSHGIGAPRRGWPSEERQRREQGALVIAERDVLDAERMRGKAFLPGGLWFCLACFGAGTPQKSAYHAWLQLLAEEQAYKGRVASVLESLPSPGEPAFIAAMPQAALANPAGPLALIGHVDLAWTYGFSGTMDASQSKKSRVLSSLEAMVRGSRAGAALDSLMELYRETNDTLTLAYEAEEAARREGRDSADRRERGHLWMARNDLRGYVLLGDPAVRLPLAGQSRRRRESSAEGRLEAPQAIAGEAGSGPAKNSDIDVAVKVAAVHALLRGDEAPNEIARRSGASLDEVWSWFDAYRAAGRGALGG